ncbi:hypothetical protein CY35_03G009400 [Sphagnum magellanicum]|nr:hypothetical protein CY35_03G009400 [Sphagnum magellanicum]
MFIRSQIRGSGPRRLLWSTVLLLIAVVAVGISAWQMLLFSTRGRSSSCVAASVFVLQQTGSVLPSVAFPSQSSSASSSSSSSSLAVGSVRSFQPAVVAARGEQSSNGSNGLALHNIVFGIAGASQLWEKRREFIKLWWRPEEMRGFVWLEKPVQLGDGEGENLPSVLVSGNTDGFRYTHPLGHPSGIRISRVVCESFRLHLPDVQWFVMGDDDTIFSTENLVRVLSKYDSREMYYIGSSSESHKQNVHFSHSMAYGGGGFAISYPLAEALTAMQDECLERYPHLFGSDDRLHACITELGVPLTREHGFHQLGTMIIMTWSSALTHGLYPCPYASSHSCFTWKKCMLWKAIDKQSARISGTQRWMKQRNMPTAGSTTWLLKGSSKSQLLLILWPCNGTWYPEGSVQS